MIFLSFLLMCGLALMALLYGLSLWVRERIARCHKERTQAHRSSSTSSGAHSDISEGRKLKVIILHPSLCIGGAERLILDVALGLSYHQRKIPVEVLIVTTEHDPTRCFKETIDGSLKIEVRCPFLPRCVRGRGKVLLITLHVLYAAFVTCWAHPDVDCFIVDGVSAALPLLRYLVQSIPIIFYCHFPDKYCDHNRDIDEAIFIELSKAASMQEAPFGADRPGAGVPEALQRGVPVPLDGLGGGGVAVKKLPMLHNIYRNFFDYVEEWSLGFATNIMCNSKFTRMTFFYAFPTLVGRIHITEDIIYPPVKMLTEGKESEGDSLNANAVDEDLARKLEGHTVFVSINRYERKKYIDLVLKAFALLLKNTSELERWEKPPLLVIAGGFDPRIASDVEYEAELRHLARVTLQIPDAQLIFRYNITNAEKCYLLRRMRALVYTPPFEHFGIVPVEAMSCAKPVIAVAQGGPCESVGVGEASAGLLCEPQPEAFASAMLRVGADADFSRNLGKIGVKRVSELFSMDIFASRFAKRIYDLCIRVDEGCVKNK